VKVGDGFGLLEKCECKTGEICGIVVDSHGKKMVDGEQSLEKGAAGNVGLPENGIELFKVESRPGGILIETVPMSNADPFDEKAAQSEDAWRICPRR
jgi:hypothetical protein